MTIYVVLFVDLFYFYKRGSSLLPLIPSSNPLSTTSSSSSVISSMESPNQKLGMVIEKPSSFQSTFIASMQSTQQFSPQFLSSSIGVSGGNNAGVSNEGYQYSIPYVYHSTQDLSLDLDVEAVKSNLVMDDESRLRVCNEDYIFSQDLFTNDDDEFLVSNSNSCSKLVDQGDDIRRLSSTSSDLCQSEISSVTGSSVVSGDVCSAITGKSEKSSRRGGGRLKFLPNMEMIGVLLVV